MPTTTRAAPASEELFGVRPRADSARRLYGHAVGRGHEAPDELGRISFPVRAPVEIDDVDERRSLRRQPSDELVRLPGSKDDAVEVALLEPDDALIEHVDRGNDLQGTPAMP